MSDLPAYVLPQVMVTRSDMARVVREVESLDNDLAAQKVRSKMTDQKYTLPILSRLLTDFLELNKIDISNDQARMGLKEQLRKLKDNAPIMHMTFAVNPEPEFLQQLVNYLRTEIHPQALVSVGLQPALIAGVHIRTPNHIHDFSVRTMMKTKRDLMVKQLEAFTHAG